MAIQQHPLPQDISSYRFRLIGDMTIKQFGFLAGFIIVGIVFYSSPLPFFFKYPLAFIAVCLGIGIAFVPVQGRSLEQWIIAFIKSIYSPTQYIWRQSNVEAPNATTQTVTPVQNQVQMPVQQAAPVIPVVPTPALAPTSTPQPTVQPQVVSTPAVTAPAPAPVAKPVVQAAPPAAPAPAPVSAPLPAPSAAATTAPSGASAPTTNLPIPFTPTTPNTLVGLTLTSDGKILDNVMVEIQSQGLTIRATRSNRLGQFMFARPLENGLYQILAEKEGNRFTAYSLQLKGDIVKPLKIQAEQ